MDEWGTSIWDTPFNTVSSDIPMRHNPPTLSNPLESQQESDAVFSFDDFDDFGEASQQMLSDDFANDFGDFGDGQDEGHEVGFDDGDLKGCGVQSQIPEVLTPQQLATWEPLRLDPLPSPTELAEEVWEILFPVWSHLNPEEIMTREGIRQAEGLGQVLVAPDSRILYQTLFNTSTAAATRTPNWTRSRIRRQHLIALGIPINLDEVMPHINGKPLPMINITTRPSSAPPGPRPVPASTSSSSSITRAGTPQPSTRGVHSPSPGLGPKPKVDDAKIAQMLELNPDTLPLLPLATLEAYLDTLRTLTREMSTFLSYLLQIREALQQDSETYNGLIAELVGEAQKMKTGPKSKAGTGRRGSGMV